MISIKLSFVELLCLFLLIQPVYGGAQTDVKADMQRIWTDRSKTVPDTARLSAGLHLLKIYLNAPLDLDAAMMILREMDTYGMHKSIPKWRANAWNGIGTYHMHKDQLDSSSFAFTQALKFTASDTEAVRANIYSNLGLALLRKNQLDSAITYFKRGIDNVLNYDLPKSKLPSLYGNMAVCYINQGNYLEGIKNNQEAIKYGDNHTKAIGYFNIGMAFKWISLPDDALANFQLSQKYALQSSNPTDLLVSYNALIELAPDAVAVDSLLNNALETGK